MVDETDSADQTDVPYMDGAGNNQPEYIHVVITHMLHRIWELQATQLIMQAESDDDRAYVQEVLDRQAKGDYVLPMEW